MRIVVVFIWSVCLSAQIFGQQIVAPPLQLAPGLNQQLAASPRLFVKRFQFEGNHVFSDQELAKVVAGFVGRELTREDLEDARRALTQHYIQHGYINSGAVLPDQPVNDGIVTLRLIEGRLTTVALTGNRWLRSGFITNHLACWEGPPLNVNQLENGLQLLRQDPNVEQLNADLRPGANPGESALALHVQDQQPFRAGLEVDNTRPPSVNSIEFLLTLADLNLTGHSDPLNLVYGIAEGGAEGFEFSGLKNVAGDYTVPLTCLETTARVYGEKKDYAVIEEPFDVLNISSESYRYGGQLRQPLWQTGNHELAVSVALEREHSESFQLGQPYSFPDSGSVSGRTDVTALRLTQEWADHNLNQVITLRSTFNVGLDAFGVTDDGSSRTAKFWSWLGQGQYAHRLWNSPNQLILRAAGQWTPDQLLPLEQFSIGGMDSVRGYRENELVRDRGFYASAEVHVPVMCNQLGSPMLQLAPFFDDGGGWNVGAQANPPGEITCLSSAGVGLLVTPDKHWNAEIYWGHPFRHVDHEDNDPQDLGFSFRISYEAF